MGQVVYPSYPIKKTIAVFETRVELLEYETAYRLFTEVYAAVENSQLEVKLLFLCYFM